MKHELGKSVVYWGIHSGKHLGVYAKLESYAFIALTSRGLLGRFNKVMDKFNLGLPGKIKRGNRFLKKHGLKPLEALTDAEVETMEADPAKAPTGSLLLRMSNKAMAAIEGK